MPFISSNSGDSNEESEDKIEFVTEPQLQVIRAFNLTMERLLPSGKPSVCLKCGKPTERLLRAELGNKIFSCTGLCPLLATPSIFTLANDVFCDPIWIPSFCSFAVDAGLTMAYGACWFGIGACHLYVSKALSLDVAATARI